MNVVSNYDYFVYKDLNINVLLQSYEYDKGSYGNKFIFEYKNTDVDMFYENDDAWYSVAATICEVIDKYGYTGYVEFKEKYHDMNSIEGKYIIVDDKVYKPYINDTVRSGDTIHYIIHMQMEDNNTLDGVISGDMRSSFYSDIYDRDKLIETLRGRVKSYYDKSKILPKETHYLTKTTEKYQNIISWFKERNINIYKFK